MDCSGCVAFEKIQQLKAIGKCNLLHVYTPTPTPTGVGAGDAAASKRDGSLLSTFYSLPCGGQAHKMSTLAIMCWEIASLHRRTKKDWRPWAGTYCPAFKLLQ